jgi:hypothetical protein
MSIMPSAVVRATAYFRFSLIADLAPKSVRYVPVANVAHSVIGSVVKRGHHATPLTQKGTSDGFRNCAFEARTLS